jgi:hypothetical protein
MREIRTIQKKYCSQALLVAIGAGVLFLLLGQKAICKGLVLGTLFSIVNFVMMGQLLPLKLSSSQTKASALALLSIFVRFSLLAVPLILSLKLNSVDFFGTAAGLFMVQLTILFHHIILNRLPVHGRVR